MCQSIGPFVYCMCIVCVCDIKSECHRKLCHLCQTESKRDPLLHKTHSGTSSASSDEHYQSNTYRKDLSWLHFNDEITRHSFL